MNYFIVDALNLAYRSHLSKFELKTVLGYPSGMFYGFLRTLISLKKKYRGYNFQVIWDSRPEKKYELYPEYKSGRTSLPSSVKLQIPDIMDALKYLGVEQYEKKGEEADDIIGTLVEKYKKNKETNTIMIYSNDKDMLQLVETGKVVVFKPKVGVSPEKFYDNEEVKKKFGVEPRNLVYYRAFDGDSSDSLKGVPRVPRKIFAEMINKYASIDKIYDALDEFKLTDNRKKAIVENKDAVKLNYTLMKLNTSLDNIRGIEPESNVENVKELMNKYEIKTIDPENSIELFRSSLNIRYTDPNKTIKLESYSLF